MVFRHDSQILVGGIGGVAARRPHQADQKDDREESKNQQFDGSAHGTPPADSVRRGRARGRRFPPHRMPSVTESDPRADAQKSAPLQNPGRSTKKLVTFRARPASNKQEGSNGAPQ